MATRSIKCIVTGDRKSGKTCLLIAYVEKRFPTNFIPCQYVNYDITGSEVIVNDKPYSLALWDTYFQMDDCALRLRPLMYPNTDVILICISTVSPASIETLKKMSIDDTDQCVPGWVPEIKYFCPNAPFILVGTMTDLREDREEIERLEESGQQPLSKEMGEDLAKEIGAVKYVECSARKQEGVKNVMDEAVMAALEHPVEKVKQRRCCLM